MFLTGNNLHVLPNSNSGLCLLAVWTVIRLVALFTFKVRVTGIWNLAKAYRCSPFSSFLKGVEFLVLASEQVKSPAKIQNHDRQKQGVLITKYARIVSLEKVYVNCPHTPIANADGLLGNISSQQKVAAEQVVSNKAEVRMSGWKTIHTQRYGSLKKQEVIVRDTTSSVKVILWV